MPVYTAVYLVPMNSAHLLFPHMLSRKFRNAFSLQAGKTKFIMHRTLADVDPAPQQLPDSHLRALEEGSASKTVQRRDFQIKRGYKKRQIYNSQFGRAWDSLMWFNASTVHSGQDLLQCRALSAAVCFISTWEALRGVNFFLVPFYSTFTTVNLLVEYSIQTRTNIQVRKDTFPFREFRANLNQKDSVKLWRSHMRGPCSYVTYTGRVFGLMNQYNLTPGASLYGS